MTSSSPTQDSEASAQDQMSEVAAAFRDAMRLLVDFVYPPRCPVCGTGLGAQSGLCVACWAGLVPPPEETGTQARVIAASTYGEVSRKLILGFKHGGKIALAPMLGRLIAARLDVPDPARIIVPVPLHPLRLWRRGYNQAGLLGRELQQLGHGTMAVDALQRTRWTASLDRRSRAERHALLAAAIRFNPRRVSQLRGANILLVDDVVTSGATARACCDALRAAGAANVTVVCFAKVGADVKGSRQERPSELLSTVVSAQVSSATAKANARDHAIPGVP